MSSRPQQQMQMQMQKCSGSQGLFSTFQLPGSSLSLCTIPSISVASGEFGQARFSPFKRKKKIDKHPPSSSLPEIKGTEIAEETQYQAGFEGFARPLSVSPEYCGGRVPTLISQEMKRVNLFHSPHPFTMTRVGGGGVRGGNGGEW